MLVLALPTKEAIDILISRIFFRPNMSKFNKKSRSDPRSRGSRGAGGRGANNTNNQSQTRNNRQQRPERSGNLF